ncbi:Helix-turn-helix [Thermanaeromonas toyohensis ToBE]|uniref:Helix-turn-helix n=1 Tax=Thermanaeromonas toyohensis ToBE TaxID=698762 RepID=A0A1W1VXD3_9FIRM|nr:helix-turn-helix transcriptional regulator [Thermanaeromonas toyohensis]SMB98015.1 Helix-turn-helix [Thermanaeromonas toyohensis ToBE]
MDVQEQNVTKKLGERLRKAREAKGLTQAQLGALLNVSDATINRYEKGQRSPDPEMLVKLAEALNVSTDYLLTGKQASILEYEAAHRTDDSTDELPEEARRSLEEFKEFMLRKYGKKRD